MPIHARGLNAVTRQLLAFGLVGGLQLVLDWACFVLLTAAGLAVVPANLAGRIAGASVGFWLNGRYTFARDGQPQLSRSQLLRFVAFWLATTTVSTLALQAIDSAQGLQAAWLLKPLVEALLAAAGFLASRHWIYR
jgi:putative flippase GtrA